MTAYHLAHLNIAKTKSALDDPAMQAFAARLDEVSAQTFTLDQFFDPE